MQLLHTKLVPTDVQLRFRRRKGSIPVLAAIMMTVLVGMLAFAIDIGYLLLAREELQRSADSAALAAAWELVDENAPEGGQYTTLATNARTAAAQFATNNSVLGHGPALPSEDVQVGYLSSFTDPSVAIDTTGTYPANAVRVIVRRTSSQNGAIPFFFANVLGVQDAVAQAETTAAILTNFGGFKAPADGSNLDLLPFALDQETWNNLCNGVGTDNWSWDAAGGVQSGSDGILEFNLYPQGTGSPGNRGTVDIGGSNNSTADIARQIVHGVSATDLAHHGGQLQFDGNGELQLNGDTGISAGVKDELLSIVGKTRIIPVFSTVTSPGNNAQYTIKKFVGVRILEVVLTGKQSNKRLIVQPATVLAKGGIPSTVQSTSYFIYSPAWIAR